MRMSSNSQMKTTLLALCRQPGKIALLTHTNPDGDGLAAALALKVILKKLGHDCDIVLEDAAPDSLDFLKAKSLSLVYNEQMAYQIIILLDCHEPERTGKLSALIPKANSLIAIDHHEPRELNKHWYYFIVPEDVSTGATLFKTFTTEIRKLPLETRKHVTDCIFTTILNDTDGFINNNTDTEVFKICAALSDLGTSSAEIMEKFIYNNSPAKLRFVGEALSSIETFENGRILFMHTTLQQLADNKLNQDATTKITRWAKGAAGVDVMVYARQLADNKYRLSIRSAIADCNRICGVFGGGGHISAAGCVIEKSLPQLKIALLAEILKDING